MQTYRKFAYHPLDGSYGFWSGRLPSGVCDSSASVPALWNLHPPDFHEIRSPAGIMVKTPRWQQAYGRDYTYSGSRNNALQIPPLLAPLLDWARRSIDVRLDSMLLNWYDAELGHYIGRHRDDERQLLVGAPIVTISFGAPRVFRLRPWRGQGFVDYPVEEGTVIILPWETNTRWTHEVPHGKRFTGRRVSVTLRAFVP